LSKGQHEIAVRQKTFGESGMRMDVYLTVTGMAGRNDDFKDA
jgi:hypothetical protein